MSLRDRMYELTEVEHVDEFLKEHPTGVFFKAGGCHKTMQGFGYVEEALNSREDVYMGFVRVIEHRPVSNYIAQMTDVVHESPQLILMKEGKVVFEVDNWDITLDLLEEAFNHHLGPITEKESLENHEGDVSAYISILGKYLKEEITEEEFEKSWLTTFQSDATPRSIAQFNQLNALYGDVDAVLALGAAADNTLRARAEELLFNLTGG